MKIEVRGRLLLVTHALREHIERRLHFSLGRFATRVARATVRIEDLNGPRGGIDKLCRIGVMLPGSREMVVEDVDSDMYAAVDRAAERAGRAVERRLARSRNARCATVAVAAAGAY